jgi:hypothetical protein
MKYLVVSQHMIDNIPLGLHARYQDAYREAIENEQRRGPSTNFPLPDADMSEYICTIIVPYGYDGRPCQCELIGDRGKSLRVVRNGEMGEDDPNHTVERWP